MIKADLINKISKEMNISKQEAETGVNLFFETIKDAIPELDVIAEHIKRFFWVGEYWFSAIFGEGTGYPISVIPIEYSMRFRCLRTPRYANDCLV